MLTTTNILKTDVWVDTIPPQPTPGGTLHALVSLEIKGQGEGGYAYLQKRTLYPPGKNPEILMLDILFSMIDIYVSNPQALQYVEGLKGSPRYYSSIEIYFEGNLEKIITKIPVIT